MNLADENITGVEFSSLESLLPLGMVDPRESRESQNAVRTIEILEKLIIQTRSQHALYTRYSLLQSLPRCESERFKSNNAYKDLENIPDFIQQYCKALCPSWYEEFLSSLTENELEVFLKNYVNAHETWGHTEGIAALVRTMLESCTHYHIPLEVRSLAPQNRLIPEELCSYLGTAERYSVLGKDFVLGKRFYSRPECYDIIIGPISMRTLEKIQSSGWAVDAQASMKLNRLVEFAEPFYLRAKFHILLETIGYVLGRGVIGKDQLGIVGRNATDEVDISTVIHY